MMNVNIPELMNLTNSLIKHELKFHTGLKYDLSCNTSNMIMCPDCNVNTCSGHLRVTISDGIFQSIIYIGESDFKDATNKRSCIISLIKSGINSFKWCQSLSEYKPEPRAVPGPKSPYSVSYILGFNLFGEE
jgi:hypothetical protein